MTLAERCFDRSLADDELFDTLQTLLGGLSTDQCLEPGFEWRVTDCWVDPYDGSVEIVIPEGQSGLTRETADKVLALGFDMVYENPPAQERAIVWTTGDASWAANKWRATSDRWEIAKLRAQQEGTITIPTAPPRELLVSMAMRLYHDFGIDRDPETDGAIYGGWSPAEREAVLIEMAQLYEEVAGKGFYQWDGEPNQRDGLYNL
jgi:hypothetical protein